MESSPDEPIRLVVDTNFIFMALYNPAGKAGKILEFANQDKLQLFSTDTVKKELFNVLKREMDIEENQLKEKIENLPIVWFDESFYANFLSKTKVKHTPDKPVEALSLVLDCGILSADRHFKNRIDINKLLDELNK